MQNNAADLLVRNSAPPLYPNQPYSSEDPTYTDSDVQPDTLPTPRQEEALNELRFFDKEKILAWITIVRCIEPGFRYRTRGACLSSQQLDALSTLKDCDDSDIVAWLRFASSAGDVNEQPTSISAFKAPNLSTLRHQRRSLTNPSQRSSASSLTPSAIFSNSSGYGTPRSSLGQGYALPELPEDIACSDESNHVHWCTYGEHSKPISTCEGWKRHEREHEVPYLCMPNGPVEKTRHGRRCALCGMLNPDDTHLARRHNVSVCVGKFKEPVKKSRRTDMIRHLAQHRIHSEDAGALADQWRIALNKKLFSCGLCVTIFSSITDRSNHIDNEHWRKGQNMDAWELSNCIRGLLLEPKVQVAWRFLLCSYPNVVESNLRWEVPLAEGLQLRLEKAEETPQVLAEAALQLSNCGHLPPSQEGWRATTGRSEMAFVAVSAAPSKSRYISLPDQTQLANPMTRRLPRSLPSDNVAPFSTGFQDLDRDPSLIPAAAFDNSIELDGFFSEALLHAGPLVDPNVTDSSSQLSTDALFKEWLMDSSQPLDGSTRIRGHLSETGALLTAQISHPQHEQAAAYAGIGGHGPMTGPPRDVSTSNTTRVPTSAFSHGSPAQLSNHECGVDLRNKPLPPDPPLAPPRSINRTPERRPTTPMDLTTG